MIQTKPRSIDKRAETSAINMQFARWGEGLLLLLILGLGGYLRIAGIDHTPGIYSDEGTLLDIAHHLLHGHWQYMAINDSTLIAARMPLFPLVLAGVSLAIGEGIRTLRLVSGALGVISIFLLYVAVRYFSRPAGPALALLSALMLAIYPHSILYSRLGFSYSLLAPLMLLALISMWAFIKTERTAWLFLAGLIIGLGAVSDLVMLTLSVPMVLIASTKGLRPVLGAFIAVCVPVGLYLIYMLAISGESVLFDLSFTITRLGGVPLVAQFPIAAFNYARLLTWDLWLIPAIVGLFMLTLVRMRWFILLMFILPLMLIGRTTTGLAGLGYHYVSWLLPLASVGIAALVVKAFPVMRDTFSSGLSQLFDTWNLTTGSPATRWLRERAIAIISALAIFVLLVAPFLISTMKTTFETWNGFATPIETELISHREATMAARFVNVRADSTDLVLASPALAWMIDAQVADFQQSLAYDGYATEHLPSDIPRERFEYDASADRARFVVVDGIWRNWAANVMPEVSELLERVETWPLVFETHSIQVFENPAQ